MSRGNEPRLVVHNTFLEFDDVAREDVAHVGRRPRAQTDITNDHFSTNAPRKVSYHVDESEPNAFGGAGSQFGKLGSLAEVGGHDFTGLGFSAEISAAALAAANANNNAMAAASMPRA
ncbi:unnamed protein product [Polarella glacialis]|uniref:Uncharacterized protein n=1 Tax=Polarella glacialis TaxID=89957 RepID=A0A813JQ55_POLGL|nr:unnamed protein product [Polarella glacialis]